MEKEEKNINIHSFIVKNQKQTFHELLNQHLAKSKKTDPEIYNDANLTKGTYSRLRNIHHKPSKNSIICLAIGLDLSYIETLILLKSEGYTLSNSSRFDLIVKFHIQKKSKIYDINIDLEKNNCELLGKHKKKEKIKI